MNIDDFIKNNDRIKVLYENDFYYLLNITDFELLLNIENNSNKETDKTFDKLVKNLNFDNFCGSSLLGYFDNEKNKIIIISGNHRLLAIKKTNIKNVLVIIPKKVNKENIARWHLSHNNLTGEIVFDNLDYFLNELKTKESKIMSGLEEIQEKLSRTMVQEKINIESFEEKMLKTELLFNVEDFEDFKKKYEEANIKDDVPKIYTGITQEDFNKTILYIKEKKNIFNISKILIELLEEVNKSKKE